MYSLGLPGVSAFLRLTVLLFTLCAVSSQAQDTSDASGVDYLLKFGYLKAQDPRTGALRTEESFQDAISRFQQFAGIPVTRKMDPETVSMMLMPRCGVSDRIGNGDRARRRKRYTLHGSKWSKNLLTYKVTRYTPKLSQSQQDAEIRRAFKVWSDVTPLDFSQRNSGTVDIEIYFAEREHGDGNPFDGRGRTLAHAYFPQFGGDAHFDNAEQWTIGTSSGTNLFQVAAHEFGHALGLSHSDIRESLMAPFYRGYQRNFVLHHDDITGVRELYGRRRNPDQVPTQPPTIRPVVARTFGTPTRGRPDICAQSQGAKIDAITRTMDGLTYVFVGKYYYRMNEAGFDRGYPRPIEVDWTGIEGPIDTALTWSNGQTFIFKGSQYWKFENLRPISGYPRLIKDGFRGIPDDLDAAFIWSGNDKTYFVKGSRYWRYTGRTASYGYPKSLSVWKGIPSTINAAFKWQNGRTYFFLNGNYHRFNDKMFMVDAGYPRKNSVWWFGCSGTRTAQPAQLPNGAKGDVHEAKVDAEQYDGRVLANYPDTNIDNNKTDTNDTSKSIANSFHFVTTFLLIFIARLASS